MKIFGVSLRTVLVSAFVSLAVAGTTALATQTNYLGTVFIGDATTPSQQMKVNSDGSINTTGAATSTPLTPTDISPSSNLTLVTGGASQTLIADNTCPNFITINNATTAAGQGGIAAAESAWVKRTGGTVSMTGGGTSTEIAAGVTQSFLASTVIMTWTAPTTGHKINAWCE